MLERILKLSSAVKSTAAVLDAKVPQITSEEWTIIKDMCVVLKPFEIITCEMSAENYVSASKIIVLKKGLLSSCQRMLNSNIFHGVVIELIHALVDGLRKYCGELEKSNTLTTCTFLDPRFKQGKMFYSDNETARIKQSIVTQVADAISKLRPPEPEQGTSCSAESRISTETVTNEFSPWASYEENVSKFRQPQATTPTSKAIVEIDR